MKINSNVKEGFMELSIVEMLHINGGGTSDDKRRQRPGGGTTTTTPNVKKP